MVLKCSEAQLHSIALNCTQLHCIILMLNMWTALQCNPNPAGNPHCTQCGSHTALTAQSAHTAHCTICGSHIVIAHTAHNAHAQYVGPTLSIAHNAHAQYVGPTLPIAHRRSHFIEISFPIKTGCRVNLFGKKFQHMCVFDLCQYFAGVR